MTTSKIVKKTKFFTVSLTMLSLIASNLGGFLYAVPQARAALSQTGPVVPGGIGTGFPAWYKDVNGLTLDLMEAADAFSISAPVEVGNAFSEQIGFGAEGFWWSADSTMDTPGGKAKLILGLEAAFAGESAVDGQQSSFGRVRYVIDGLTPGGTYTIKHPYGTVTEVADAAGSMFVTEDIGCFAAQGATSCDPNSPLGSPLPQFNFSAALSSNVGPFLTWDTFDVDPLQTDPALLNAGRQYVGDGTPHAVIGSPINQNIFRVEGPGLPGGAIETNLFSVTGRLSNAAAVAPVIDPIPAKTVAVSSPISFTANATDANLDAITFSVTPVTSIGNEVAATIVPATGVFSWTPTTAGTSTFTIGASDGTTITTTTVTIEVTAAAPVLTSISVTPATASIVEGATRQMVATALDAGGAQIVPTPTIAWTSSDETKATVNVNTGLVTAVTAGTATISATAAGVPAGTSVITVTPSTQVGGGLSAAIPVDPISKFPKWYKNRNGFALELMKADDAFGISAPVEVGNTFSEAIGFGAEGFWSTADAVMTTAGTGSKPAVLVQAVEAAFSGGEIPVDGQQSAFGRIRIRIDINEPGEYVVTYPYGQKTYTIAAGDIGAGYEINDTNDIGCFAIEGVSSCDPNNVLGSPQAGFNFNAVGLSEVGPFLSWDTFNLVSNDPLLTNPANSTRKYVGDARVAHAIQGSPTGNNFFRVESATPGVDLDPAPGVQNFVQTNLFNVSGMLADVTPPVITLNGTDPDSVIQGTQYVDPGVTVVDDVDGAITTGIVVTGLPLITDPVGAYIVTYSVSDSSGNNAVATRIVNVTPANSVVLVSAAPTIVTGATQQLSVAVLDPLGAVITPTPEITFTAPADPLVVTVDAAGIVTAVAPGTTTVTATVAGATVATVPVTVVAPLPTPVVTTVEVAAATPTIVTGATEQLSVAVLDQNGIIITPAPVVTFTPTDPAVVTVDAAGIVTAVAPGTTNVTVASAGVTDAIISITVAEPTTTPVATTVNVATAAPTIIPGTTQQLSVAVIDQVGAIITPAPVVTFTPTNTAVVTVDAAGIVTAVAPGTTNITVTTPGVADAIISVTVAPPTTPVVTTVDVATAVTTIVAGTTQQLSVAVLDQNGAAIVSPPVTTLVSDATQFVDVNPTTGVVTAVAPGTATITLTSAGHTDTQEITVVAAPAAADTIVPVISVTDPNPATVIVNTTYTDAGATASDNIDGDITANILTAGLPINTAILGPHVVTYSVSDAAGNDAIATRIVNVVLPPVVPPVITRVEVTTPSPTVIIGEVQAFEADAHDQNGVKLLVQPTFTWASDNTATGTINGAGSFTALAAGTTNVTATDAVSGLVGTFAVTVTEVPPTLSNISITTPAAKTVYTVGDALDIAGLEVTGTYSDSSTNVETLTIGSVTGFNSATPAIGQVLTVTVGGQTTTFTINVVAVQVTPTSQQVYRFWSESKKGHFYTASESEKEGVLANDKSWELEGAAFKAISSTDAEAIPVYRFWSQSKQHHFYTASATEKDGIINNDNSWNFEGIAFYAYRTQQPNTAAVHRFWSDTKQGHFYTTSVTEKESIEANDKSWSLEGTAYYVPTN